MTSPLTDERLAEIEKQINEPNRYWGATRLQARELFSEVKRLREREKVLEEVCRGPVLTADVLADLEISAEIDEANGEHALTILLQWAARCRNLVKENTP